MFYTTTHNVGREECAKGWLLMRDMPAMPRKRALTLARLQHLQSSTQYNSFPPHSPLLFAALESHTVAITPDTPHPFLAFYVFCDTFSCSHPPSTRSPVTISLKTRTRTPTFAVHTAHSHGVNNHERSPPAPRAPQAAPPCSRRIRATMGLHRGRATASAIDIRRHARRGRAHTEAQGRQLHPTSGHDAQVAANHA
jgi:hypothetical protein